MRFLDWLQRRFQVVIMWGLSDAGAVMGEATNDEIEKVFSDGCATAVNDEHTGRQNPCPHPSGTLAHHWWTRGYAYYWRTFRALRAEGLLEVEKQAALNAELQTAKARQVILDLIQHCEPKACSFQNERDAWSRAHVMVNSMITPAGARPQADMKGGNNARG